MTGEDGRAVLAGEDVPQAGDIVLGRGLGELRGGDVVALGLQALDHSTPAGPVGPGAMDEDNIR
jgi:hypothetical protein